MRSHLSRFTLVRVVLFLISALFVACNSADEEDKKQIACDGTVSQVQDLVAGIVESVALPGFAGCAPDAEQPGGYMIQVTSSDVDVETVRAAIIGQDPTSAEGLRSASLRKVLIDVSNIGQLYMETPPRLISEIPDAHRPEWQWVSSDLDEQHDQILIGYSNTEARAWAQDFILTHVDAPPGAIVAFMADPGQDD